MTNDPLDGLPSAASSRAPATPLPPAAAIAAPAPSAPPPAGWEAWLGALDARLRKAAPLLFDEATAAFESIWFRTTFWGLLGGVWLVSIPASLAAQSKTIQGNGVELFWICLCLLAPALILMPPIRALYACAHAREFSIWHGDLSRRPPEFYSRGLGVLPLIPTGSPAQVVGAKLAGAALQGVACLTALAPGFAFAYMLGGVPLPLLLVSVGWIVLASAGLTFVCLAAAARLERVFDQWAFQIFMIGFVPLSLLYCFALLEEHQRIGRWWNPDSAVGAAVVFVVLLYASFLLLLWTVAVAGASQPSADRSTGFRIAVLIQFALFSAWMGLTAFEPRREDVGMREWFYLVVVGSFALIYGAFLTGEPEVPSRRIRRTLPTSFWRRAFTLWLRPGGGTGYVFFASLTTAAGLMAMTTYFLQPDRAGWWSVQDPFRFTTVAGVYVAYPILYLGLERYLREWGVRRDSADLPATLNLAAFVFVGLLTLPLAPPALGMFFDPSTFEPLRASPPKPPVGWRGAFPPPPPPVAFIPPPPGTQLALGFNFLATAVVFLANLPSMRRGNALRPDPPSEAVQARLRRRRALQATQENPSLWDAGAEPTTGGPAADGKGAGG